MACILSSRFLFLVDVYDKKRTVSRSGQTSYEWVEVGSIKAGIRTISNDGIRVAGTTERIDTTYQNVDWITVITRKALSRSVRITNVRDLKGNLLWVEEELKGSKGAPATWFNINGASPVLDPFGRIIEYTHLASRAEVQGK